jgi:hypothetical protein
MGKFATGDIVQLVDTNKITLSAMQMRVLRRLGHFFTLDPFIDEPMVVKWTVRIMYRANEPTIGEECGPFTLCRPIGRHKHFGWEIPEELLEKVPECVEYAARLGEVI